MSITKKLRTPIIKPRTQGGTFYTFGSALEDIGLSINNESNKVELSHYVLLNLPTMTTNKLKTNGSYSSSTTLTPNGDAFIAEAFQDYILNMETVLRNQSTYNYAAKKTVSERVFWKWLFNYVTTKDNLAYSDSSNCFYEKNSNNSIVKGFGRIYSGSQRSDDYGLYNETFVQIPSSYGQMRGFFKTIQDENYSLKNTSDSSVYYTSNIGIIENIDLSEYDNNQYLYSTGLKATGIFDSSFGTQSSSYYQGDSSTDFLELILDIETLRNIYDDPELSYDDIGFGRVDVDDSYVLGDYNFNTMLIYYSIFNQDGSKTLATNLYGVYFLNKSSASITVQSGISISIPTLSKKKTTPKLDGTSFSFRLNIKPTSAYSGDITIYDNSSGAYSMSEDFNDVIRNLNAAITTLKSNATVLKSMEDDYNSIKNLSMDVSDKVSRLEDKLSQYEYKSCDSLFSIQQTSTVVTDPTDIAILNGKYNNLKTSSGESVYYSKTSSQIALWYKYISNDNKMYEKIRFFNYSSQQGTFTYKKEIIKTVYSFI